MQSSPPTDQAGDSPVECDVLVIGGGPAGSTVAALLAQKGRHVVLLDKDRHPRFHIGESLLPANLPLFERLGVADEMRAIGIKKRAAEFMSPWHEHKQQFLFADAWDKTMPHAYQVRRSEFDQVLLRRATQLGAHVREGCKVTAVDLEATPERARAQARCDDGRTLAYAPRFVVDASGRDTFLASRFQIKHKNPQHNSVAVYGHFKNVRRNEGEDEGNIIIFWFEHGWFWFIPLQDGVTSIGMVTWPYFMKTRGERSLQQFLLDGIRQCPPLLERMAAARLTDVIEATGNYSYSCERNHGRNYVMLGDAYAFIDPVFSSGVLLAMNGAVAAAEAIHTCLSQPAQATAALQAFDQRMQHGPKAFSWFIYRMTNPIMRDFFMYPQNRWRVKEAVLSVLAGDIFGKTPIWRSIGLFKMLYYGANLVQPKRAWQAWRRRQVNIRQVDDPELIAIDAAFK